MISPFPGGKRRLIRGGGSAARIINGTGAQDPGGGEVRLTDSRDTAVTRPMFQPTPQSVVERSDEVGVSAVVVDATRRGVDCTKSTVSDSMSVVAEEMQNSMDGCMDFAWEVAVVVTSPAVRAGDVALGVALPAVAGAASPSDLAEVIAVDVSSLASAGMVTVGVAGLADAWTLLGRLPSW